MEQIIIIGCGGHAKSIVDAIETAGDYEIAGFIDKGETKNYQYRGYKVIGNDDDLPEIFNMGIRNAVIGIGYMGKDNGRMKIGKFLKEIGYSLPVIQDVSAQIARDVVIGEGTFVGKNVVINSNTRIGECCIINTGAIIEHDVVVGYNTHISVGAVICGNVKIGDSCMIGANATVIQQRILGNNVIVGAGAVLIDDAISNCTMLGIPAKLLRKG